MASIYGKSYEDATRSIVENETKLKELRKNQVYNPHNDNPTAGMYTRDVYDFNPDLREMGYTPKIDRTKVKRAR